VTDPAGGGKPHDHDHADEQDHPHPHPHAEPADGRAWPRPSGSPPPRGRDGPCGFASST
jgi:hypothetical protein